MQSQELSRKLGVTQATIERWRQEGMPGEKRRGVFQYDPLLVRAWLLETGKAVQQLAAAEPPPVPDPQGPVHTKIRECAVYFGVHERTVKGWLTDPTFPGRSGKAGDSNTIKGYFPARAIAEWLTKSGKRAKVQIPAELDVAPVAVQPTSRDRLVDVKTEQAIIELKRMQGKMLDAEEALAFYRRTNAYAATVFKTFPSQLQAELPASIDDRTRAVIFRVAQKVVNSSRRMLAELIEGDKDRKHYDRTDDTGPA